LVAAKNRQHNIRFTLTTHLQTIDRQFQTWQCELFWHH